MNEISNSVKERPWQATVLGVLAIIGAIFAFLAMLFMLFFGFGMVGFNQFGEITILTTLPTNFALISAIVLAGAGILEILIARGVFKGQKWAPTIIVIFAILGLISTLSQFQIIILVVNAFILYLGIICIKHPFFNK